MSTTCPTTPTRRAPGRIAARLATLGVDIGSAPALPRLLVVESAASAGGKNEWMFWPLAVDPNVDPSTRHKAQLGVSLPADDDCVTIRIYGVEGHPLFEEQRCAPDRCVIGATLAGSTCGAPWQVGVDVSGVAADSCKDTKSAIQDPAEDAGVEPGSEMEQPATDPQSSGARSAAGGGCGVAARDPVASGPALMFAGWMLLARARRRRKTR